jgi:hypothetical protein
MCGRLWPDSRSNTLVDLQAREVDSFEEALSKEM